MPLLELVEREELAEVAADAELAEALDLEDQEADEGHPDRDVHVARWRPQELDLADGRDQPDPVVEQDRAGRTPTKIGMYGAAVGPAIPSPKSRSNS